MTANSAEDRRRALLSARLRAAGQGEGPSTRVVYAPAPLPMSAYQQPLWLLQQMFPGSKAAHVVRGYELARPIDRNRADVAARTVAEKFWLLTAQISDSGVFEPTGNALPIHYHDVRRAPWLAAQEFACSELPAFDLSTGPLARFDVFGTTAGSILVLSVHHVVADEVTISDFMREFVATYRDPSWSDTVASESAVTMNAAYERLGARQALVTDAQRDYWRGLLADLHCSPLPISHDKPPAARTGGLTSCTLMPDLDSRIGQLAASLKTSEFQVFLSAWLVVQARHLQSQDVALGVPLSVRSGAERDLPGYFLNLAILRLGLDDHDSFADVVEKVRGRMKATMSNATLPMAERATHQVSMTLTSVFSYAQGAATNDDDFATIAQPLDHGGAAFDLTVIVSRPANGPASISLEFDDSRYSAEAAGELLLQFVETLAAAVAEPQQDVQRFSLISEWHRQSMRRAWQQCNAIALPELIDARFDRVVREQPKTIAVRTAERQIDYADLSAAADRVGAALQAKGAQSGSVVAVCADDGIELLISFWAIVRIGAIYLPLDARYPVQRLRDVLADAGAVCVVVDRAARLPDDLATQLDVATMLQEGGELKRHPTKSEDPAYLIYTSGSSGRPKGVLVSHRAAAHSVEARSSLYPERPERFLLLSSPAFDSSLAGLLWTQTTGGTLCIPSADERRAPDEILRHLSEWRITHTLCLPALWHVICRTPGSTGATLQRVILAGESLTAVVVRRHFSRFANARLSNEYGPTEMAVWSTGCDVPRTATDPISIGRPLPHVHAMVVDKEGRLQAPGVPGELWLAGPGMADGYYRDTDRTQAAFVAHPMTAAHRAYRTGDRVVERAGGDLTFLGRIDNQVKVRGFRVELDEIEQAITSCEGINAAAVLPYRGESLEHAFTRLTEDAASEILDKVEVSTLSEAIKLRDSGIELALRIDSERLLTPRASQRDWLIRKAMREWMSDIHALHQVASTMVAGTERRLHVTGPCGGKIAPHEIMEDWQIPIMQAMARIAGGSSREVLEIGFGRGIASQFLQETSPRVHTIVEAEPSIVKQYFQPWVQEHRKRDIRLIEGRWQDVGLADAAFDSVLFHAYPLDESEFFEHIVESTTYAEHAIPAMARVLRPGGVFTYLSNEIDSLSRQHQRLLLKYFGSVRVEVCALDVPADTRDAWWAPSMVIVEAVK